MERLLSIVVVSLFSRGFDAFHGQDDLRISLCDAALALAAPGTSTPKVNGQER